MVSVAESHMWEASKPVRAYLTAWLSFGLLMGAFTFASILIETGEFRVALLMVGIPVALSSVFGLAKYGIDKRRGQVEEILLQQQAAQGLLGSFSRDLVGPSNLALYAAIASIIVRAAGGPVLISVGLLLAGVIALVFARRKRTAGANREC